jgi:hypothetical protein
VYLCRRQHDKVLVLMNLGKVTATFRINHPALAGNYHDLFSGEARKISRLETFDFQPGEYLVYHLTN